MYVRVEGSFRLKVLHGHRGEGVRRKVVCAAVMRCAAAADEEEDMLCTCIFVRM